MKLLHAIIACVLLGITAGAAPNSNAAAPHRHGCELLLFRQIGNVDLIIS